MGDDAAARVDGFPAERRLQPTRRYWLHVIDGPLHAAGRELQSGDALGLEGESGALALRASGRAQALLFDLPL